MQFIAAQSVRSDDIKCHVHRMTANKESEWTSDLTTNLGIKVNDVLNDIRQSFVGKASILKGIIPAYRLLGHPMRNSMQSHQCGPQLSPESDKALEKSRRNLPRPSSPCPARIFAQPTDPISDLTN